MKTISYTVRKVEFTDFELEVDDNFDLNSENFKELIEEAHINGDGVEVDCDITQWDIVQVTDSEERKFTDYPY